MRNTIPQKKSPQNRTRVAGTDLSLAQYAETLATLLHHGAEEVADVVARLGVTSEEWNAAERAWNEVLTCTGHRDDGAISLEFTSLFARARKRLGLTKAETGKLGVAPTALHGFDALAPFAPRAPEQLHTAEVPSYLREDRPTPFPDRAPPPTRQYPATMALPIMRPDQVMDPAIPDQSEPTSGSTQNEDDIAETAEVDVRCFRAPLPFSGASTKPSAEPAASPPPGKRLVRFDPQTGEPLSSPKWADVPVVVPAPSPLGAPCDEDSGHATAAVPIVQAGLALPFSIHAPGGPARRI